MHLQTCCNACVPPSHPTLPLRPKRKHEKRTQHLGVVPAAATQKEQKACLGRHLILHLAKVSNSWLEGEMSCHPACLAACLRHSLKAHRTSRHSYRRPDADAALPSVLLHSCHVYPCQRRDHVHTRARTYTKPNDVVDLVGRVQ